MHRLFTPHRWNVRLRRSAGVAGCALPAGGPGWGPGWGMAWLFGGFALLLSWTPLSAANFGGGAWDDPDPEATARAVQVHLLRLASADAKQVEQATLGIESLGLSALPLLQTALADKDCAAALKPKLQALVDTLLESAVITVNDPAGLPLVDTGFEVRLYWDWDVMLSPEKGITHHRKPLAQFVATTSATGRLVIPGIPAPKKLSGIPHVAERGAVVVLRRKNLTLQDGIASETELSLRDKQPGQVLALNGVVPRGVTPRIRVSDSRNRPISGAAVLFIPVEDGTARWSRSWGAAFAFDPATQTAKPDDLAVLARSLLWNPATALSAGVGCCSPLTDADGGLQAGRVAPGTYALQVIAPGYQRLTVPDFKVPESIAEDAEPVVLKMTPTERCFLAGTLKTADGAPLKQALAYLLPADQVYDAGHIVELADFERRQRTQRRVEAIKAGRDPATVDVLPQPAGFTAATVPLVYLEELTAYPQIRTARTAASGRLEIKNLAEGKYVLRVFVGPADAVAPIDLQEYRPADGTPPPMVEAKSGAPIDLATLQYKPVPPPAVAPAPAPSPAPQEGAQP